MIVGVILKEVFRFVIQLWLFRRFLKLYNLEVVRVGLLLDMCIYIYVWVYAYIYIRIGICIYQLRVYIYIYIRAYVYVYICVQGKSNCEERKVCELGGGGGFWCRNLGDVCGRILLFGYVFCILFLIFVDSSCLLVNFREVVSSRILTVCVSLLF